MQAYQSAPCPYCGITWNPPGAQACGNCRNALPTAPPAYAPPGYPQGQPPYQGAPQGYPGQGEPYPPQGPPGMPYAASPPSGYPPYPYPTDPYAGQPGYPGADPYAAQAPYQGQPQYPGQYAAYPQAGAPPAGARVVTLFGRALTLPVALPPALPAALARLQHAGPTAVRMIGALAAVLFVVLVILPAVASGQISGAGQALATAASQQGQVDAAMGAFLKPSGPAPSDPAVQQASVNKELEQAQSALAQVQADEAAIASFDQRLTWLSYGALPKRAAIADERRRTQAALTALKGADQVLTAAVDQARLSLPLIDAFTDYGKMQAALAKNDLAGAEAPFQEAQQLLDAANQRANTPGIPPVAAQRVKTFTDLVTNYDQMILAIQNKDAAGKKTSTALVQSGTKAMSAFTQAAVDDWNSKTFSPLVKAYDAGLKSLRAA